MSSDSTTRTQHVRRINAAATRTMRATPAGLLDLSLGLTQRFAGFLGSLRERGDARVRWLELRNKITAYRLFAGHGRDPGPRAIHSLDPYARLFAAEGYAYRNAHRGVMDQILQPEWSPISVHAGIGLRLAEQALEAMNSGMDEIEALAEFSTACRHLAREGCYGIVEEALGLVARTLYPHWMKGLDARLRAMDTAFWERFWHGAGRGIYFAPGNSPPFRAVPWSGVHMCAAEPPHQTARRNALSGFCFALTLVNLRQPEVMEAFFQHHGVQAADGIDGIQAAIAVCTLSGGCVPDAERLAAFRPAPTARTLWPLLQPRVVTDEDRRHPERLFSAAGANFALKLTSA